MRNGIVSENKAFGRKYILQIGVNKDVKREVFASTKQDYVERKREKDSNYYSERYKTETISSNDLTTVPQNVVTITDPIHIVAKISDPKDGEKTNINKTTIEIFNLSKDTSDLIKTGASIFLRAGYIQDEDDLPHIFIGQITKVRREPQFTETVVYIEANACEAVRNGAYLHKTYPKGSDLSGIINDLAKAVAKSGIPVGSINSQPIAAEILKKAYPSGYMVTGSPLTALERVCNENGLRAYVSLGRLYIEPIKHRGQLTRVVTIEDGQFKGKIKEAKDKKGEELSKDEDFKDNFDLKLNLNLNGEITKDAIVRIFAKGYEGDYTIKELTHNLDWKKGPWDTDVTLLKIEN